MKMETVAVWAAALLLALPAAGQHPPGHQHPTPAASLPAPEPIAALSVPDVSLVDQEGRPVRFYSDLVRGKTVVVSFVFTTCTTVCPPLGVNFAKLRQLLGERAGRDVQLISVSIDPANDTPARLKAWAAKFGAGPGWTQVTGEKAEVTRLLKALGAYTPDVLRHTPLVLLGNEPEGRWTRAFGLAPASQLLALVDQMNAAPGQPDAKTPARQGGQP